MEIVKIDLQNPPEPLIAKAAEVLSRGGLLIYPTDTAYGLGGNGLDERVIRKVFRVKGRLEKKPIHVVVRDIKMAEELVYLNEPDRIVFERFLPGPLTLIFKKKKIVPESLVGGGETLGIRMPKCLVTRRISSLLEFPYTATSANLAGGPAPYSIEESLSQFSPEILENIDLILNAGPLLKVLPSTIVDLSGEIPKLVREGPVSKGEMEKALDQKF